MLGLKRRDRQDKIPQVILPKGQDGPEGAFISPDRAFRKEE